MLWLQPPSVKQKTIRSRASWIRMTGSKSNPNQTLEFQSCKQPKHTIDRNRRYTRARCVIGHDLSRTKATFTKPLDAEREISKMERMNDQNVVKPWNDSKSRLKAQLTALCKGCVRSWATIPLAVLWSHVNAIDVLVNVVIWPQARQGLWYQKFDNQCLEISLTVQIEVGC